MKTTVTKVVEDCSWERDAQEAIEQAWDRAKWDPENKCFIFQEDDGDGEDMPIECETLEETIDYLQEVYERWWDGSVPWDGGRVFEPDPFTASEFLNIPEHAAQIAAAGWEL